jgi:hypothetical protein
MCQCVVTMWTHFILHRLLPSSPYYCQCSRERESICTNVCLCLAFSIIYAWWILYRIYVHMLVCTMYIQLFSRTESCMFNNICMKLNWVTKKNGKVRFENQKKKKKINMVSKIKMESHDRLFRDAKKKTFGKLLQTSTFHCTQDIL